MSFSQNPQTLPIDLFNNFYELCIKIIDAYYLQPLPQDNSGFKLAKKIKTNLRDGHIERELHGAMHASRVQFFSKILHDLFKKLFPNYSQESLHYLTTTLKLTEDQLLTLIKYAALFHDSARKNESTDFWDKKSAQKAYDFFIQQGLSKELAEIFSSAAAYKDKPNEFKDFLLKLNINDNEIKHYQYIRKLIAMSDCIDIMRCNGNFRMQKFLEHLKDISEYKQDIHDPIMLEFAKEVYKLIRSQHDMLFATKIILPNGEEVPNLPDSSDFSLKEKVKYEHAKNPVLAIGKSFKENKYFSNYFNDETFNAEENNIASVFNPFIHGTNSFVLANLQKTQFNILSPVNMIEEYNRAPMGGEINGGGLSTVISRCDPCFGKLMAQGVNDYTLQKIIANYTRFSSQSEASLRREIEYYSSHGFKTCFTNINILLIYLMRSKQLGVDCLTQKDLMEMQKQLDVTIQFLYLVRLLGTKIHPNYNAIDNCPKKDKGPVMDGIYTHLRFEKIAEKIMQQQLNMQEIYENPTTENLNKALALLELPKDSIILSGISCKPKQTTLPITQVFSLDEHYDDDIEDSSDPKYFFYRGITQNTENFGIHQLLQQMLRGQVSKAFFNNYDEYCEKQISMLRSKSKVLDKIVNASNNDFKFTKEEDFFLQHKFPMVLICEDEEKIQLLSFSSQEYRSSSPLQVGRDITMIATDTLEHQLTIMKYLEDHHIYTTQVILFDQLMNAQKDHQKPQSQFTHADGFPLLSWMAAKKVPSQAPVPENVADKVQAAGFSKAIKFG